MSTYNVFSDDGLTALTDHMKTTRAKAEANASALGGLGADLAGLAGQVDAAMNTKQDKLTFDTTPTVGSVNPVTSGGISTYVTGIVGNINTLLDTINGEVV